MLEAFPYRQEPYNMSKVAKGLEEMMYNDQSRHLDSTYALAGLDIDNKLVIYQRGRDKSEMLVKRQTSSVQFSYLPNEKDIKYIISLLSIEKTILQFLKIYYKK
ncbi:hypothetical protein COM81_03480 [Priestia megaterium]|nr:hypothetical protein COM81_03480 [Priestia megaterium]